MKLRRRLFSEDNSSRHKLLRNVALLAGGGAILAYANRSINKAIAKRKKYLNASEEERESMERELELKKQKDLDRFAKVIEKFQGNKKN